MKNHRECLRILVLTIALSGCALVTAGPPEDRPSKAEAEAAARDLIDGISESYDCNVVFESLFDGLNLDTAQFTVMVRMNGKDCGEALQDLRHRGAVNQISFGEMRSLDMQDEDEQVPNTDLIHEVNPGIRHAGTRDRTT